MVPIWRSHDGYVVHYAGEVPDNKEVVSLLVAYGGLDAHTNPSTELARQFIYADFLANVPRVSAMLSDNAGLSRERYARGDTALHHAARNGVTLKLWNNWSPAVQIRMRRQITDTFPYTVQPVMGT